MLLALSVTFVQHLSDLSSVGGKWLSNILVSGALHNKIDGNTGLLGSEVSMPTRVTVYFDLFWCRTNNVCYLNGTNSKSKQTFV